MSTVAVSDASFATDVLTSPHPVLVDFWAEWCAPCRALGPTLEQLASEFSGKITVAKINIEENPAIAQQYRVRSIPTLMLFKDGSLHSTKVGALPREALAEWVRSVVQSAP
jgi:thioredoxin 1